MTEQHIPYGRGEVDDRIALLHRTSADLDASVRAWADDAYDDDESVDEYVCPFGHTFTTDGSDRHCPICQLGDDDDDEPDPIDSFERMLWLATTPPPDYYMDGGRLRRDV